VPTSKDLKRIVRARMKKTGESYTAARAHVVSRPKPKEAPAPTIDHAALAGMSNDKVAAKTGRTWPEWVRALDADNASTMTHRSIAELVHGKHNVPDWWAQTVTVGYERIKGLRDRGQRRGGGYEAGKTRTFEVPVKALFDAWADDAMRKRWLGRNDVALRTATSPKTVRLQWPDGTIVVVGFLAKGKTKSVASVVHTKLPDRAALDTTKRYWTGRLDALESMFADRG
jgi:hypothetical protein